jgi:2-amino-4-hydroxy-6-hydroxymethyldihydropteridine diphosphokinase
MPVVNEGAAKAAPAVAPQFTAYIALGSNLGDASGHDSPIQQIERALRELHSLPQTQRVRHSCLYQSPPAGHADQPDYVNAVAEIRTRLTPGALLEELLKLEIRFGRRRLFRNAPRTLDLDLLLYDARTLHEPGLTLPHPRMHTRPFVLVPLLEIAPKIEIPGHGPIRSLPPAHDRSQLRPVALQTASALCEGPL